MDTIKRLVMLLIPYGLLRRRMEQRYNEPWRPVGVTAFSRVCHDWLPALFACVHQNMHGDDRRIVKYWLPYRMMKLRLQSYYNIILHGGVEPKTAWGCFIRNKSPYGLVLWWDKEIAAMAKRKGAGAPASAKAAPSKPAPAPKPVSGPQLSATQMAQLKQPIELLQREQKALRDEVARLRAENRQAKEQLEALLLRVLLASKR